MARVGSATRRKEFVKAAVRVIAEHGVKGATTRRIATEAGSPLASLHYVFHTKEDLFYAVYESLGDIDISYFAKLDWESLSPGEVVANCLRISANWFLDNPELTLAQQELFTWASRSNPEVARKSHVVSSELVRESLKNRLNGRLDDSHLASISALFIALVDGIINVWSAYKLREEVSPVIDVSCDAISAYVSALEKSCESTS